MKEFIETFRTLLNTTGELLEVFLNTLSLICILTGVVLSFTHSARLRRGMPGEHPLHLLFRVVFGGWLVLALEFQLAADIVSTIISPTTEHLIKLAAVATIRTFLNYFLNKELLEESKLLEAGKAGTLESDV